MKRYITTMLALCIGVCVLNAQEKPRFTPQKGTWTVGVTFNPASIGSGISIQPKNGEFAGDYLEGLAANPKQMFIMSKDPMAAIKFKYYTSSKSAFRVSVGINGSLVNYKEYVQDDMAKAMNPDSQNQVVDRATSSMNSFSVLLGKEWTQGKGVVRFTYGFDFMYTVAGGKMFFKYGNAMTDLNRAPSTMPMTQSGGDLNNYIDEGWGIEYGRPVARKNIGYIHGIGISADAGIEVFLAERLSLSAALNFTPVMFTIQPQTYSVFEGFSIKTGKVEQVNGLVSPGSNSVLYGTQNIGCRISLTYYL